MSSWFFPVPGAHNWFPFNLLLDAGLPLRHGMRSVIGSRLLFDPTTNGPRGGGGSGDAEDPEDPEDPEAGG